MSVKRDEMVGGFMARLADDNHGEYLETALQRAKAEGFAEAQGKTLNTSPIAITEMPENVREPAGAALERILERLREKHALGTRVRVTVEVVYRQPGERGGPEDM